MINNNFLIGVMFLIIIIGLSACAKDDSDSADSKSGSSTITVLYTVAAEDADADDLLYVESDVPALSLREGSQITISPDTDYGDVYISLNGEIVDEIGDLTKYSSYKFTAEESGIYILYAIVDGEVKDITGDFSIVQTYDNNAGHF